MCKKKILLDNAGKWIILCCSSPIYKGSGFIQTCFPQFFCMRAHYSSKGLLGIIHQKHKTMSYAWGLLEN